MWTKYDYKEIELTFANLNGLPSKMNVWRLD